MRLTGTIAVLLTFFAPLSAASAQQTPPEPAKPPQLKLEVIPSKTTYIVGETLAVKYRLTSLMDGTLCFPRPTTQAQQSDTGYLKTEVIGPDDRETFIEHSWERRPNEEQLRERITSNWVRLGMSEPYQPRKPQKIIKLDVPGEWKLQAAYQPPSLTPHEMEIVRSMGCMPPDTAVHAPLLTVTVIDSTK